MTDLPQLLKPAQIAKALQISESQVYALFSRGDLPPVRLGRSVRARPEDVVAFINKNLHRREEEK